MRQSTEGAARAAIYRKAAQMLESRAKSVWPNGVYVDYACEAIETAIGYWHRDGGCDLCATMRDVYKGNNHSVAWLAGISSEDYDVDEDRNGRVLALCFMAAMVEAGDA